MASTKFVSQMSDGEIGRLLWDAVGVDGDALVAVDVDRREEGEALGATVRYTTRLDGDDEDSTLSDYYEVDDYDIEPYDWGGSAAAECLRWRRALLDRFGEGYALRYLVGMLEEVAEGE